MPNSERLTADTITDEQIRKLRECIVDDMAAAEPEARVPSAALAIADCWDSVDVRLRPNHRTAARARCAEILNARNQRSHAR